MKRFAALLLLVVLPAAAASGLAARIEKILSHPAARRAFWGVKAVDVDSGKILYQHNPNRLFVPASNAKLFSTALALTRLGPEHRYLTLLATDHPPDAGGRIPGDLVLVGRGDPNLSSRVFPYEKRVEFLQTPLAPIEELADEILALGVREIDGDIVGDDTYYLWERYIPSWAVEDITSEDGPPVAALAVNDNLQTLRIRPGAKPGDPATVVAFPAVEFYQIDNRVRTIAPRKQPHRVRVHRDPGGAVVHLWGEIRVNDPGHAMSLAIDDPALFAAKALRDVLVRRGIRVAGGVRSRHAMPFDEAPAERSYAFVLASRSSMPLIEDLRVINKVSQNTHAEMVVREVARQRRGVASLEASRAEMDAFLKEIGIAEAEIDLRDASGLSRMNLVSPDAIVKLLVWMWRSPYGESWVDTLPVAGSDGTLSSRFTSTPTAERVLAKTGTLTHVSALSGYGKTAGGRNVAFAILVNNYGDRNGPVRGLIDQICVAIVQEERNSP